MCNSKGSILVITVGFALVFTMLGIASIYISTLQSETQEKQILSQEAFWLAEAGLQRALWGFNKNGNKTFQGNILNRGDYDTVINAANTIITSKGSSPDRAAIGRIERNIVATISNSPFKYSIFGDNSVSMGNNAFTDSYDSSLGAYGGTNVGSGGDVGSNGDTAGAISLSNNVNISGDVSTGSNGTVTTANGVNVIGATTNDSNVVLPPVVVPASLTSLPSGGTYIVNGTATLNPGNYRYTNIDMENNAIINVSGAGAVNIYLTDNQSLITKNNPSIIISSGTSLNLYIDGKLTIENNIISNQNSLPGSFIIYSTYTGNDGIEIKNNSIFYGAIYAPQTDIAVNNNGDVYGSLIGETADISNNNGIHYDSALSSLGAPMPFGGLAAYSVINWQEV